MSFFNYTFNFLPAFFNQLMLNVIFELFSPLYTQGIIWDKITNTEINRFKMNCVYNIRIGHQRENKVHTETQSFYF